MNFAILLH